ncbi:transposable element Tcb1 transposase [Trichonephila clavipes]|nr:transposable element Tcb1 transposase [Trichonephila clavipes]
MFYSNASGVEHTDSGPHNSGNKSSGRMNRRSPYSKPPDAFICGECPKKHLLLNASCRLLSMDVGPLWYGGAISWRGLGPLVTLHGKVKAAHDVNILGDQVHPFVQTSFPGECPIYQDDNAPIHTAKIVQEWFAEHEGEVGHLDWPPQSPDLNIIEHLRSHKQNESSGSPKNLQASLEWTEEAENSFTAAKTALADATLFKHPIPVATLSVRTNASKFAIRSFLMQLSNEAEEYRKEYIREAFIRELKYPRIRQRLLENTSMTLDQAFEQARTLESAEVHAASYMGSSFPVQSAAIKTEDISEVTVATSAASSSSSRSQKCFLCGNDLHSRTLCPTKDVTCRKWGKRDIASECANLDLGETLQMWWLLQTLWQLFRDLHTVSRNQ